MCCEVCAERCHPMRLAYAFTSIFRKTDTQSEHRFPLGYLVCSPSFCSTSPPLTEREAQGDKLKFNHEFPKDKENNKLIKQDNDNRSIYDRAKIILEKIIKKDSSSISVLAFPPRLFVLGVLRNIKKMEEII